MEEFAVMTTRTSGSEESSTVQEFTRRIETMVKNVDNPVRDVDMREFFRGAAGIVRETGRNMRDAFIEQVSASRRVRR